MTDSLPAASTFSGKLLKVGNFYEEVVDFYRIIGKTEVKAIGNLGARPGKQAPLKCETIKEGELGYIQSSDSSENPAVYWPWTQSRIQTAFHPIDCLVLTGNVGHDKSGPKLAVRKRNY